MTHFLVTEEKPDGHKLEDILTLLRADVVHRCSLIVNDKRPEAKAVLANNVKILGLLTESVELAEAVQGAQRVVIVVEDGDLHASARLLLSNRIPGPMPVPFRILSDRRNTERRAGAWRQRGARRSRNRGASRVHDQSD